jgi:choline-sulfatase
MPFADMPEKYRKMYDPGTMPLRQNVKLEGPDHEWWHRTYLWDHRYCKLKEPHTLNLPKGFGLRELTALYYGMISWVDDIVGRLMESLRISCLENNTIVLFTSDHGDNLGSHGFFNKDRLTEESIRIPMITRWPERLAPLDNRQHQAQLIDIMPTLLDLAGCEIPPSVQGRSLSPLLYGQQATMDDNLVFIETPLKHIGIRTATHKYGMLLRKDYSIDNENFCFYDLVADPYEEHNLIGAGKQEGTAKMLRDILGRWHLETPRLSLAKDTGLPPVIGSQ